MDASRLLLPCAGCCVPLVEAAGVICPDDVLSKAAADGVDILRVLFTFTPCCSACLRTNERLLRTVVLVPSFPADYRRAGERGRVATRYAVVARAFLRCMPVCCTCCHTVPLPILVLIFMPAGGRRAAWRLWAVPPARVMAAGWTLPVLAAFTPWTWRISLAKHLYACGKMAWGGGLPD